MADLASQRPLVDPVAGKRIVLGVSGGISAYKAIQVCRYLVERGAHVVPVLTESAKRFVGSLTFDALASEPAHLSMWDDWSSPIPHTRLGQQADLVVICPATARVIGSFTAGIADDLLTNTLIATTAPVLLCPAMHTEMWQHPAVVHNIKTLRARGVQIVDPEQGRLAGGDTGTGRLANPLTVVAAVEALLSEALDLGGLEIVVTAGGTREAIDPIRFIGNRSTGKQGYAFAEIAALGGARVTLITTVDRHVAASVEVVRVDTAAEMHQATMMAAENASIVVMAAAVADFRPATFEQHKIKKAQGIPTIDLEPTVDILADLGSRKPPKQVLVGFAAETSDLARNANRKLIDKKADLIVGNDVSEPEAGFAHDTNRVTIFSHSSEPEALPLATKQQVAIEVLRRAARLIKPMLGGPAKGE